jgi:hypothetical protein
MKAILVSGIACTSGTVYVINKSNKVSSGKHSDDYSLIFYKGEQNWYTKGIVIPKYTSILRYTGVLHNMLVSESKLNIFD